MALSFTEDAESRAHLGFSNIQQTNVATPAVSDYPTGGYPINPQNWGLGLIRGLLVVGYTGTATNYAWLFIPAAANLITNTYAGNLYVAALSTGAQVAAGTDLSGGTVKLKADGF
jgi:hypothetical protein